MIDFHFTNDFSLSKLDEIVSFLLGPRLWIPTIDYPDYYQWADKVHHQLRRQEKRALVTLSYGHVVGVLIYQRHPQYLNAAEFKNLTVRPDNRGRYIASFLLRNAEVEAGQEFDANTIVCDAKAKNLAIRYFLLKHRYQPVQTHDLYGLGGGTDVVYRKRLLKLKV